MPKRTNEFQQFIYSIQHQLASGAVSAFHIQSRRAEYKFKVMNRFTPPTVGPLSLIHEPGRETSYPLKDFLTGIARYGPLERFRASPDLLNPVSRMMLKNESNRLVLLSSSLRCVGEPLKRSVRRIPVKKGLV